MPFELHESSDRNILSKTPFLSILIEYSEISLSPRIGFFFLQADVDDFRSMLSQVINDFLYCCLKRFALQVGFVRIVVVKGLVGLDRFIKYTGCLKLCFRCLELIFECFSCVFFDSDEFMNFLRHFFGSLI